MAFKVKLVSEKKLRKNQQAQNLSQGIGSLLGSLGQTMAQSAQRRAAEDAGAQLNQQLGLNVPSNVYGQASPSALLGMLANAQMAARAQTENMNRIREAESVRGRAKVEAEKLRLRAEQGKPKITVPKQYQPFYGGATELPIDAVPADTQKMWLGVGGTTDKTWDWKKAGIPEQRMRELNAQGVTPGILSSMTEAQRGKLLNPIQSGGTASDPIKAELDALAAERLALTSSIQSPMDLMLYGVDRKGRGSNVQAALTRLDEIASRMREISGTRADAHQQSVSMPGAYAQPAGPAAPGAQQPQQASGEKIQVDQAWMTKNAESLKQLSSEELQSLIDDLESQGFDTTDLQDMLTDGQ